jgi:hypothetical protein
MITRGPARDDRRAVKKGSLTNVTIFTLNLEAISGSTTALSALANMKVDDLSQATSPPARDGASQAVTAR